MAPEGLARDRKAIGGEAMNDRLQEIRARLDAATPGPWYVRSGWVALNNLNYDVIPVGHNDADADLIAHAPADIAWLLAEIEKRLGAKQ